MIPAGKKDAVKSPQPVQEAPTLASPETFPGLVPVKGRPDAAVETKKAQHV